MDTMYLQWNVANWITVVLMTALGFMIFSLLAQVYKSKQPVGAISNLAT